MIRRLAQLPINLFRVSFLLFVSAFAYIALFFLSKLSKKTGEAAPQETKREARSKDELVKTLSDRFDEAIAIALSTEPTEEHFVTMFQLYSSDGRNFSEQQIMNFASELHTHLHADAQKIWMQEAYDQRLEVALLDKKDFEDYYKQTFLLTTEWSDSIQQHLIDIGTGAQYIMDTMGKDVN